VVGFTVDRSHLSETRKHELPVVPFDALETHFPPQKTAVIVPLGFALSTGLATERRVAAMERGYASLSYISSRASVSPDLQCGDNCLIFDGVVIEPFVKLGSDIIVRGSCHLSQHVSIAGACFLAPRVTLGGNVSIAERCFIGINATVQGDAHVASGCFIAAGARVIRDTNNGAVYAGAPAVRRKVRPADLLRTLARQRAGA
jgi:sugar O-acyltransferase (sialic acid O-acetyltransferase NeuD family)